MTMKKAAVLIMGVASFLCISLIVLFLVVPSGDAKPDQVKKEEKLHFNKEFYERLEKKVIADAEGAILNIERNGKLFDVTLSYGWYDLSKGRQKEVADFINKKIYNIAIASDLIKPGGNIDVMLIDPAREELKY